VKLQKSCLKDCHCCDELYFEDGELWWLVSLVVKFVSRGVSMSMRPRGPGTSTPLHDINKFALLGRIDQKVLAPESFPPELLVLGAARSIGLKV
jgi:hypothetical protein